MEFDLTIAFCPKCKDSHTIILPYCGKCGTKIIKQKVIICMDDDKVTRILKK